MKHRYVLLFTRSVLLMLVSTALYAQGSQDSHLRQLLSQAKTSQRTQQATLFSLSNAITYNTNTFKAGERPVTLAINNKVLKQIVDEQPALLELSIPTNTETLELELVPVELFMPNSKLLLGTQNGTQEAPFQKGLFYQGFVKNKSRSLVSISIIEGELTGFVSDESGNRVLSRLKQNPSGYLFYKDNTIAAKKEFICTTDVSKATTQLNNVEAPGSPSCKVVGIYFEADYAMFQSNGSNVTTTTNYIMGLFNQVATIYNKENIAIRIAGIKVWTEADPYTGTSTANVLPQFLNYVNANPPAGITFQLGHLLSTRDLGGGRAYLDVLCNSMYRYGVSGNLTTTYADFPNYSWEVMVVSHEMGHNFGSPHTQSCTWVGGPIDNCVAVEDGSCAPGPTPTNGGTVMSYCHVTSYGINLANGFGPQPGDLIRNRYASGSCIPAVSSVPTSLAVRSVQATSANVYWVSESGSTSFTLQYRPTSSGTWTTVGPFLGPQYKITGLQPNTAYTWRVTGDCAGGNYSAEATFTTGQPVYCTPTYSNNGCSFAIGLKSVTLNGVAMTTNSGCSPTYFTYYPTPVVTVSKDNPNTFTVDFLGYYNAQQFAIWIDFDNSYEFEPGERVYFTTSSQTAAVTATFTIPSTAPSGVTRRMRIRDQFISQVSDPCGTLGYGETEDYLVNITGGVQPPATPNITASTDSLACAGQNVTLSVTNCPGTVTWQPGGATGSTLVVAPTAPTTYTATCTVSGSGSSSNTILINPVSTMFTKNNGNWTDPNVWTCNRVPLATDVLTVRRAHTVTMPASYTGSAKSMSVFGRINYLTNAKLLLGQ